MHRGIGVGELDPGDAADHVGAKRHRLPQQIGGARFAHDAVLGERDDLKVDDAAKFLAHADERLDALEPGFGIDVGEGADVQIAVKRRQSHGAAGIGHDPICEYFSLMRLASSMLASARPMPSP